MHGTSVREGTMPVEAGRRGRFIRSVGGRLLALSAAAAFLQGGCVEFVHWGHISDRDGTWGIGGVEISQQQPDGTWRRIGGSDGKGRWEVFKHKVRGGGRIRLRKRGYHTRFFPENEFLQQHMILMQASGEGGHGEPRDDPGGPGA